MNTKLAPHRAHRRLLWVAILIWCVVPLAYGFDDQTTHPLITERAIDLSTLDATLRNTLSFSMGKNTVLAAFPGAPPGPGQSIARWLQTGSTREDNPTCRASNHFHNPLKEYTAAGLTDLPDAFRDYCAGQGFSPIRSSATWGTKYTSPNQRESSLTTNNDMDWDIARTAYFDALTKGSLPSATNISPRPSRRSGRFSTWSKTSPFRPTSATILCPTWSISSQVSPRPLVGGPTTSSGTSSETRH